MKLTLNTKFVRKPPKNSPNPKKNHTHYLDNKATLTSISTPERKKQKRHALRENEHYILDPIRETLKDLDYYTMQKNPFLSIDWIKGHSGNPLHEKPDRHAARIAFRHTTMPQRYPESTSYPFCLYLYECLVEEDIRQHIQLVCKEIWLKRWRELPTQGRLSKLTTNVTSLLPKINVKDTRPQDSKLHAKFINGITHTPHRQHMMDKSKLSKCALCP